jgi:hypothetical protein
MNLSRNIEEEMRKAIDYFAISLNCKIINSLTHSTLIISGWNDNMESRKAIAHYLVGLRASAIDAALNIKSQLEDTPEDLIELYGNVMAIIGKKNDDLSIDQKQDERNPWICEGICHLGMTIALQRQEIHPMGEIVAIDYPHIASKDHGLDVLVLYKKDATFGLSIIETKAYKLNPAKAINNATKFFKEIEEGKHDLRLRQSVHIMRTSLAKEVQQSISGSFWKRERTYIANPHYDSTITMEYSNNHPIFLRLFNDKEKVVLMPNAIVDFDLFFDQIADEMRNFVESL